MYKERSYYTFTEEEYDRFVSGEEVWKSITGHPDYEVSTMGRIKSLKFGNDKILTPWNNGKGYLNIDLDNCTIKAHQLVAIVFLGHKKQGMKLVVHHLNSIRTDNRLLNLEIRTNRQNCYFKTASTSSKYVGVCWAKLKQRWQSQIKIGNKIHFLGRFKDEDDAGEAYQSALKMINKEGLFNFEKWKKSQREKSQSAEVK